MWAGSHDGRGRPQLQTGSTADGTRRVRRAHQLVWEVAHGSAPAGMDVHHTCGNRRCVNLAHLELVPHGEHARRHASGKLDASYALHVRWHVRRGRPRTGCRWCG